MAGGRKSDKLMRDAIKLALHRTNERGTKYLTVLAEKLVQRAAEGDVTAIKEVCDRVDGKAPQAVNLSGQLDFTKIERTIVDPQAADS